MDLHYRPEASRCDRDGMRPSEIARQRPALATRIQGHESYHDFDARRTERGGHFTEGVEEFRPEPLQHFEVDSEERTDRLNRQLRSGHLSVEGDAE